MPCDGGIGICRNDACGETACLNETGYCSSHCQDEDERGAEPADD